MHLLGEARGLKTAGAILTLAGNITVDGFEFSGAHVPDANVSHFIGYDWVDGRPRPSRLY